MGRELFINDQYCNQTFLFSRKRSAKFVTNHVSNAKYSLLSFFPLFVQEQFSNYANIFFLLIGVLQQFPAISPTNRFTTLIPLALVLILFAAKEIYEELERRTADWAVNKRPVTVVDGSSFLVKPCHKLLVGEIVKVVRNEQIPADIVALSCSDRHLGRCYVETVTLDGESNLKEKKCLNATKHFAKPIQISQFVRGTVNCDEPNNDLNQFNGAISLKHFGDFQLEPKNLLLRGSVLKKVDWVCGVCVYTGKDCKIIRNAPKLCLKQTLISKTTNRIFIFIFFLILSMALASATMNFWLNYSSPFYRSVLFQASSSVAQLTIRFLKNCLTFLILYNNLIPVSLIVTCELIKIQHAKFIAHDLELYDGEGGRRAEVHSSNIVEDLGQISYVFSDKTGTLTQNKMSWKEFVCGSETRSLSKGVTNYSKETELFIHALILCNSALPVTSSMKNHQVKYETSCSDDLAVMTGCSEMGFILVERTPMLAVIKGPNGKIWRYRILQCYSFCYERKRVTVIVQREGEQDILVLAKGSDTTVAPLCKDTLVKDSIIGKVNDWSYVGLRTMVVSSKTIERKRSEDEKEQYCLIEKKSFTGEDFVWDVDKMETDSTMLGAIAIEDKLVSNLRETVEMLTGAGIKMFILTGDKLETTLAVATACNLITLSNPIHHITTDKSIADQISNLLCTTLSNTVVVCGGEIFDLIEENEKVAKVFVTLISRVKSGIFFRFSPLQKAKLVALVKQHSKRAILAIGDGANDVGMIQMASVGVGIHGREGFQAARASDISIGKFCMLSKLILVHGFWCYQRLSKTIIYSLYKNTVFYMAQFLFAFFNQFSGQTLFESWMIGLYNVLFTVVPPFMIGLLEKNVTKKSIMQNPRLFQSGITNSLFNWRVCLSCLFNSIFHSIIVISILFGWFYGGFSFGLTGRVDSLWLVSCIGFSCIIVTVTLKAALITNNWTVWAFVSLFGTFILYFPILAGYITVCPMAGVAVEFRGLLKPLFQCPLLWISLLLIPVSCLLIDYCWKYYRRTYMPSEIHVAQELEQKGKYLQSIRM